MSFLPRTSIVVPIDESDESFKALEVAIDIAESPEQVSVVMVISDDMPVAYHGLAYGLIEDDNRLKAANEELAKNLAERFTQEIYHEIRIGDPGSEIIEFAKDRDADLIVMPSHGRRGIFRLLLGSVAERVLRLAHCPVLILRGASSKPDEGNE